MTNGQQSSPQPFLCRRFNTINYMHFNFFPKHPHAFIVPNSLNRKYRFGPPQTPVLGLSVFQLDFVCVHRNSIQPTNDTSVDVRD